MNSNNNQARLEWRQCRIAAIANKYDLDKADATRLYDVAKKICWGLEDGVLDAVIKTIRAPEEHWKFQYYPRNLFDQVAYWASWVGYPRSLRGLSAPRANNAILIMEKLGFVL